MSSVEKDYQAEFSEQSFWDKAKDSALSAGSEVMEKALCLYYALQRPETPAWAKATIVSALGYFIFPVDAIPDFVPVVGYADDLGVLALAVTTVAFNINADVKRAAAAKMQDFFGQKPDQSV